MRLTTGKSPSIAISPRLSRSTLRGSGHGTRRGSAAQLVARRRLLYALRALWLLVIFLGEYYSFYRRVHSCHWPERTKGLAPYKLLIVSDPQIPDHRSYPDRSLVLQWLGQAVIDNFLRKSWRIVTRRQRPDAIVFNGDLLDSGHQASDRLEHANYVKRFRSIFPSLGPAVPILYLPGNHDVGLHLPSPAAAHAREQFRDAFGPLNGQLSLGNHTIIWLDSMSLLEDRARAAEPINEIATSPDSALAFVRTLQKEQGDGLPRVLFSHIPLWRAEGTTCGTVRESRKPIREGRGLNYQNMMDEDTSKWLLEQLAPEVVFSGDDHDACIVKHSLTSAASYSSSVTEHTVRSFAMNMGVAHPGYELVSLYPASSPSEPTYEAISCVLPFQVGIYLHWYIPLLLFTLLTLLVPKLQRCLSRIERRNAARANGLPLHTRTPSFLDYGNKDSSALLEEEDEPGFGYVSSPMDTGGPQYSYHHGATDDDMPTSAVEPQRSPRRGERPSMSRVRRVSRVWLWDGRSHDGRDTCGSAPPPIRAARRHLLRLARPAYAYIRSVLLSETARELWAVAWPALSLAVVNYIWHW